MLLKNRWCRDNRKTWTWKPVGYIEQGKDATVAYDYLDLKFENNNDFDLKLKAYIEDDKVCVDIYKIA